MSTSLSDFTNLYRTLVKPEKSSSLNREQTRLLAEQYRQLSPEDQKRVDPGIRQKIAADAFQGPASSLARSPMPAAEVAFSPSTSPEDVVFDLKLKGTAAHKAGGTTDDIKAKVSGSIDLKQQFVTDFLRRRLTELSPGLQITDVTWDDKERRYVVEGSASTTTDLLVTTVRHRAEFKAYIAVDGQRGLVIRFPWGITNLGNFFNGTAAASFRDGINSGAGNSVSASADGNQVFVRPDLRGLTLGSGDATFRIDSLSGPITYGMGSNGNLLLRLADSDLKGARLRQAGQPDSIPSYSDDFSLDVRTRIHHDGTVTADRLGGTTRIRVVRPGKPSSEHTVEVKSGQLRYTEKTGFVLAGDVTESTAGGQRFTLAGFRGQTVRTGVLEMRAGTLRVDDDGHLSLEVRSPKGELNLTQGVVDGLTGDYALQMGEEFKGSGTLTGGQVNLDDAGKVRFKAREATFKGQKPDDPQIRLTDIAGSADDDLTIDQAHYRIRQGKNLHGGGDVQNAKVVIDGGQRRISAGSATYVDQDHPGRTMDMQGVAATLPEGTGPATVQLAGYRYQDQAAGLKIQADAFQGHVDLLHGGTLSGKVTRAALSAPQGQLELHGAQVKGTLEQALHIQADAVQGTVKGMQIQGNKGVTADIDQRQGLRVHVEAPEVGLSPSEETEVINRGVQFDANIGPDKMMTFTGTNQTVQVKSGTFRSTAENFRYQGDQEHVAFQADRLQGTSGEASEQQVIAAEQLAGEVKAGDQELRYDLHVTAEQARLTDPGKNLNMDGAEVLQHIDLGSVDKIKSFEGKARRIQAQVGPFQGEMRTVSFQGNPQVTTGTAASLSGRLNLPDAQGPGRTVQIDTGAVDTRVEKLEDTSTVVDVRTPGAHIVTGSLDTTSQQLHARAQQGPDGQVQVGADAQSIRGTMGSAEFALDQATAQGDPQRLTIQANKARLKKDRLVAQGEGMEVQTSPAEKFTIKGGRVDRISGRFADTAFEADQIAVTPLPDAQLELQARQGKVSDTRGDEKGQPRYVSTGDNIRVRVAIDPGLTVKGATVDRGGLAVANDLVRQLLMAPTSNPTHSDFLRFLANRTVADFTLEAGEFDPATHMPKTAQGNLSGQMDSVFGPVAVRADVRYDGKTTTLNKAQLRIPASDRFAQQLADSFIAETRKHGRELSLDGPPRFENGKLKLKFDQNDLELDVTATGDKVVVDIEKARFLWIISVRGKAANRLEKGMRSGNMDPTRQGDTTIAVPVAQLVSKIGLPESDKLNCRSLKLDGNFLVADFDYSHTSK